MRRIVGRLVDEIASSTVGAMVVLAVAVGLVGLSGTQQAHASGIDFVWADPDSLSPDPGEVVSYPTQSPYTVRNISGIDQISPETALARLFVPEHATEENPVPAVVMLHGAGGVLRSREITYARQLKEMGIAALVIDSFASRAEGRPMSFTRRVFQTTEMMMVADAYGGLNYLHSRPEIDGNRVALVGFSYGGMATKYALQQQVANRAAREGQRFVGHAAYYGPCIARFEDRSTTGAPMLILMGGEDAIVNVAECEGIAQDMRDGGSDVRTVLYPDGYHQWDGALVGPRRINHNLADCRLRVSGNGTVRDDRTGIPMVNALTRFAILAFCVEGDGYLVGRNDEIRAASNAELGAFLDRIFQQDDPVDRRETAEAGSG